MNFGCFVKLKVFEARYGASFLDVCLFFNGVVTYLILM